MTPKETSSSRADIPTTYEKWVKTEGIPIITGYYIGDLRAVPLKPWARKGGLGAFVNLEGAELTDDAYICEIPPGGSLNPQRHLFEEMIYVLSGRGATTIWNPEGKKRTFEWQAGSLFAPPLNVWHQHFNGQGDKPARYLAVTGAPLIMNLFHNVDFVLKNDFVFKDRYSDQEDYFSGKGRAMPEYRVWESNFVPDVKGFKVEQEYKERGFGRNVRFELSENTMAAHISEFPVGTYKKAHRHKAGAHVIILNGIGYSLLWRVGEDRKKIDWHEGSMFVPPDMCFHQHFNAGREPARYMALRWGSQKHRVWKQYSYESVSAGGDQIEYDEEDPAIRKLYESELAKQGVTVKMPPVQRKK